MIAYLSLGSNIADREANLRTAIDELKKLGIMVSVSPVYETEPVGFQDQPDFLNCVVAFETILDPHALLASTQNIENSLGRVRTILNGPRTIDIDILMYGDAIIQTDTLTIPHPRMHERRFVLTPFADIAPDAVHPTSGKTVRTLLNELHDTVQVTPYGAS